MRLRLFALHDSDEAERKRRGSFEVTEQEARRLNTQGYGVFWCVNEFKERRVQAELLRINAWFCELDTGTKAEQTARVKASPLLPSFVVESARSLQCYWLVSGEATLDNWKRIVKLGLVPALGGDPKATDPLRLLRAPGYDHLKEPDLPYPVRVVWEWGASYTERQMLIGFPDKDPGSKSGSRKTSGSPNLSGDNTNSFWWRVAGMDARVALPRLNGHWLVAGESFELREMANGNANIVRADGTDTGCFVDGTGRLGNVAGGSSVAAWCAWYGHGWHKVAEGLKEVFPEVVNDED